MGIIVTIIPMDFSRIDFILGQSGNTQGQKGDGNNASKG